MFAHLIYVTGTSPNRWNPNQLDRIFDSFGNLKIIPVLYYLRNYLGACLAAGLCLVFIYTSKGGKKVTVGDSGGTDGPRTVCHDS